MYNIDPQEQRSCTGYITVTPLDMKEDKLLFIHKDASSKSLSHSDGAERSRILQHIQLTRIEKLRSGNHKFKVTTGRQRKNERRGGKSSGSSGIPGEQGKSLMTEDTTDVLEKFNHPTAPANGRHELGFFLGPFTAFPSVSSAWPSADTPSISTPNSPSFPSSVPVYGNTVDPFDSACVPLTAHIHRHIQYYLTVSHPRIWQNESQVFNGAYQFKEAAWDRITHCLTSQLSMAAMLASSAAQMQFIEQIPPIQDARVLIHKAILVACTYVRELAGEERIDDDLIYDINALANAEFFAFDIKAARVHLRFVRQLIDQTGGLGRLNPFMKEWFLAGDENVAAEVGERPYFHFSEYDPGPLPEGWRTQNAEGGRLEVFVKGCHIFMSSKTLETVVLDLVECVQEMKSKLGLVTKESHSITASSYEKARWLHLRTMAARSRLLHLESRTWREEITRLALLAWAYMTMTVTGRRRTMKVMASRLQAVMSVATTIRWKTNDALLLWILIVGGCASEGNPDQQAWFFEKAVIVFHLQRGPRRVDILTESAVVEILDRFLYVEEVQRPMVHDLFENLGMRDSVREECHEGIAKYY